MVQTSLNSYAFPLDVYVEYSPCSFCSFSVQVLALAYILLFPVSESAADGVIQHSEGSKRWGRNPIIGNPWENNKKKIPPFFFDMITVANKRFAVRTFR
jgi:hypothetical protein